MSADLAEENTTSVFLRMETVLANIPRRQTQEALAKNPYATSPLGPEQRKETCWRTHRPILST